MLLGAFAIWIALLFAVTHAITRLVIADPAPTFEFTDRIAELASSPGPPEINAATSLLSAARELELLTADLSWKNRTNIVLPDTIARRRRDGRDVERARELLARAAHAMSLTEAASKMEFLAIERSAVGQRVEQRDYENLQTLILLHIFAMTEANRNGDWLEFERNFRVVTRLSALAWSGQDYRLIADMAFLLELMLGAIQTMVADDRLDQSECLRLIEMLHEIERFERPSPALIEEYRLRAQSQIHLGYSEEGLPVMWRFEVGGSRGHGYVSSVLFDARPTVFVRLLAVFGLFLPDREAASARVDEYYRLTHEWYDRDLGEFDLDELHFRGFQQKHTEFLDPIQDRWYRMFEGMHRFSFEHHPLISRYVKTAHEVSESLVAVTIVGLRIKLFELQHGRLPRDLAEAVPEAERIDPRTGTPIRYYPPLVERDLPPGVYPELTNRKYPKHSYIMLAADGLGGSSEFRFFTREETRVAPEAPTRK